MNFGLKDILQTAGPTAALVFPSRMFLQLPNYSEIHGGIR
jgi:hypothetical protein